MIEGASNFYCLFWQVKNIIFFDEGKNFISKSANDWNIALIKTYERTNLEKIISRTFCSICGLLGSIMDTFKMSFLKLFSWKSSGNSCFDTFKKTLNKFIHHFLPISRTPFSVFFRKGLYTYLFWKQALFNVWFHL